MQTEVIGENHSYCSTNVRETHCEEPFVSIIISNYNDKEHLRECLESLRTQDYRNFEVVVVDNSSTDGSVDMVRKEFSRVRLLIIPRTGIAKANNAGFSVTKGNYVVFDLNSDDVVSSTWLKNLVEAMENDLTIGIACGKRYFYGTHIIDSAGASVNRLTGETPAVSRGRADRGDDATNIIREVDYAPVLMVRREALRKVGLLDESYYFYYEDPDLCLRVKKAGYKVVCVTNAIHWHHGSATIGKFSERRYYYLRKNQLRFVIKNFPLPYMMICVFWLLTMRSILDSLCTIPIFRYLAKVISPHSLWANSSRSVLLLQVQAILWNILHLKDTLTSRASLRSYIH